MVYDSVTWPGPRLAEIFPSQFPSAGITGVCPGPACHPVSSCEPLVWTERTFLHCSTLISQRSRPFIESVFSYFMCLCVCVSVYPGPHVKEREPVGRVGSLLLSRGSPVRGGYTRALWLWELPSLARPPCLPHRSRRLLFTGLSGLDEGAGAVKAQQTASLALRGLWGLHYMKKSWQNTPAVDVRK